MRATYSIVGRAIGTSLVAGLIGATITIQNNPAVYASYDRTTYASPDPLGNFVLYTLLSLPFSFGFYALRSLKARPIERH